MPNRQTEIKKIACEIADNLMTGAIGVAERLQLRGPDEEDFGGRIRRNVEIVIETILHKYVKP